MSSTKSFSLYIGASAVRTLTERYFDDKLAGWSSSDGGETFPDGNEMMEYKVYSWRQSGLKCHESIVFIPDNEDYDGFIVELAISRKDKKKPKWFIQAERIKRLKNVKAAKKKTNDWKCSSGSCTSLKADNNAKKLKSKIIEDKINDWKDRGCSNTSLKNIQAKANKVTRSFQSYDLIFSNCQIFVHKLLEQVLGKKKAAAHQTTVKKLNKGADTATMIGAPTAGVIIGAAAVPAATVLGSTTLGSIGVWAGLVTAPLTWPYVLAGIAIGAIGGAGVVVAKKIGAKILEEKRIKKDDDDA